MDCPRCLALMTEETLQGHLGRPLVIDLCYPCQAFWFDSHESLRLSPASTLKLFRLIGERIARSQPSGSGAGRCPRCHTALRPTVDMQRNTRFEYLRCPDGHGRWTTFYSFLREKDFIRPLSPEQLDRLRQNVQSVDCSNCGAPIDLTRATSCGRCGSPLSMLDMARAEQLVAQLQKADRPDSPVDPSLPSRLAATRRQVHAAFDSFERDHRWRGDVTSAGLVGAGLKSLARWFHSLG
jgi:hypothetical protein